MVVLQKWKFTLFSISFICTFLTGTWLLLIKYFFPKSKEMFSIINDPLQPYILKLHILVAAWMLFCSGYIFTEHALNNLKDKIKRGRKTGITLIICLFLMILSGYLIQVFISNEHIQHLHIIFSFLFSIILILHQHRIHLHKHKELFYYTLIIIILSFLPYLKLFIFK